MEENIKLGLPADLEMPPEPPQKRAEELEDAVAPVKKPTKNRGFEQLKQPQKKSVAQPDVVKQVTPEEAKAEALRPKLDRPQAGPQGKIVRKGPKGQARPI